MANRNSQSSGGGQSGGRGWQGRGSSGGYGGRGQSSGGYEDRDDEMEYSGQGSRYSSEQGYGGGQYDEGGQGSYGQGMEGGGYDSGSWGGSTSAVVMRVAHSD